MENKPMTGADEFRLRSCLKMFRSTATMIQNLLDLKNAFANQGIVVPAEKRREVDQVLQARPWIKGCLLTTEQVFIQKGWSLPRWKKPEWLLESDY